MIFSKNNPLDEKTFQVVDKNGKILEKKYVDIVSAEELLNSYKTMKLSRMQDIKQLQYQRQGRLLTFAPTLGQEALQLATAVNLRADIDFFVPAFRSNALWLALGHPMEEIMRFWNGNEAGMKVANNLNILPTNIPIATQFSHAAGIAYANKLKGNDSVAVSYIGDGGTSEGEFYEAINFAAVHNLPVIFVIQNNGFAISTSINWQTRDPFLAKKGIGIGLPKQSIRVDGNDYFAMRAVMAEAVSECKKGNGPFLIEAMTYRMGPHTTADDPTVYRNEKDHEKMIKTDPLLRLKKILMDRKIWDDSKEQKLDVEQEEYVNNALEKSMKNLSVSIDEIFDHTYQNLTENLKEQKEEAKKYFAKKGV